MKTEKLYENNGMCFAFHAKVLSAQKINDGYAVILDRTAFFPEGGGQTADKGYIANAYVRDVQIVDGEILHYTDTLPESEEVDCQLETKERFRKMQNHLGEHLLCGAIHKRLGYDNVGFHLGADYMTFDISGPMTDEQILQAEIDANRAVWEDAKVNCYIPSKEDLAKLCYRSKSEKLEGADSIRIVEVENYDRCACCAPHFDRAGKIGAIKIIDSMHYKGGMRFSALCGYDALLDYNTRLEEIKALSSLFSAKPHEIVDAANSKMEEIGALKGRLGAMRRELVALKLQLLPVQEESHILFEDDMDNMEMREFATAGMEKTNAVFLVACGTDGEGYRFTAASKCVNLKALIPEMKEKLNLKGGGSPAMITGRMTATKDEILAFFKK